VTLIDANLLLYAYNPSFALHDRARDWLQRTLSSHEAVCLAWATVVAFIRIGTNPRAFEQPLTAGEAVEIVSTWLTWPSVDLLDPGDRHWEILSGLLAETRVRGPLVADAHLAALAIEHGATLASTDRDFSRFPGLSLVNPLA